MSKATTTRRISRATKYVMAASLNEKWALLSKGRKRYARYLVERYGWPVKLAIQHAYIFGFDSRPLDYRTGMSVAETRKPSSFGF